MTRRRCDAMLFDLDGTLIDSAPDLAGAANALRSRHGLAPLPYAQLRPLVGTGARGIVGAAFGVGPEDDGFPELRDAFLALYEANLLVHTVVFPGMPAVLEMLAQRQIHWGIVTNKATRFATPVVNGLGLHLGSATLVCGDTTARAKPHPDPLLEAARRVGVAPERCVYVGDDLRDVQAGRAAGMATLAAAWGYLGQGPSIDTWGADCIVNSPSHLLQWLDMP